MRILVLGAGLQGSACAFDLLNDAAVTRVMLADVRVGGFPRSCTRSWWVTMHDWCPWCSTFVTPRPFARRYAQLRRGVQRDPVLLQLPAGALAVEAGVHFCDLGGNTEIVRQQKALHDAAVGARA